MNVIPAPEWLKNRMERLRSSPPPSSESVEAQMKGSIRQRKEHWATKYIGKPYVKGARGPDAFDCWGLFWTVMQADFGLRLPEFLGITLSSALEQCGTISDGIQADWLAVGHPSDGIAVALSQSKAIHHVGIWMEADGGKILHAYEGMGVVATSIREMRIRGFKVIDFYRHRLWRS